jgi:pimeloyl-ACP methyl ester carboxylesterase
MKSKWNLSLLFIVGLLFAVTLPASTVDGIEIHSAVRGNGPNTVILVHGWTCDSTTWKSQVPALVKDYRVVMLDLPGHGKSGSPAGGDLTMDLFARAVEAVRQEADADRVVLVGHSMGTPVVMQYARLYPEHVAGLVFVDGIVSLPENLNIDASFSEQFAGPDGLKAREAMIRGMFSSATTPEMQKHILSMMLGAPEKTATGAMKAMFAPEIWKEDIFTQPVLGLYVDGSNSLKNENVKRRFPSLDYHEIAGTGHFLMLEKPEEFNRLLQEFLDRVF